MCECSPTIPGLTLYHWTAPVGIFRRPIYGSHHYEGYQSYRYLVLDGWRVAHVRRVMWRSGRTSYSVYCMDRRGKGCTEWPTEAQALEELDQMVRARML